MDAGSGWQETGTGRIWAMGHDGKLNGSPMAGGCLPDCRWGFRGDTECPTGPLPRSWLGRSPGGTALIRRGGPVPRGASQRRCRQPLGGRLQERRRDWVTTVEAATSRRGGIREGLNKSPLVIPANAGIHFDVAVAGSRSKWTPVRPKAGLP